MEDIKILTNIQICSGFINHVGLYKNYMVIIDSEAGNNCYITKDYPYKNLKDFEYIDFKIESNFDIIKSFRFNIDFENISKENMKAYTKRALKHIGL